MYDLSLFKMASCTGEECITPKGLKELDGGPRLSLNTSAIGRGRRVASGELSRRRARKYCYGAVAEVLMK